MRFCVLRVGAVLVILVRRFIAFDLKWGLGRANHFLRKLDFDASREDRATVFVCPLPVPLHP
jgi:hypothetical protein